MSQLKINDYIFKVHPGYDLYAASKDGQIIHILKKQPADGFSLHNGDLKITVCKYKEKIQKNYFVHRFVWECFNGIISDNKVIDHKNDIKTDNRLDNLQMFTQENCKKSAEKRDYSFAAKNYQNRKYIRVINLKTNQFFYFNSLCYVMLCYVNNYLALFPGHVYT